MILAHISRATGCVIIVACCAVEAVAIVLRAKGLIA